MNQPPEHIAQLQEQLARLQQENAELRTSLETCQSEQRSSLVENLQPSKIAHDRVSGGSLEHRLLAATAEVANALLTIARLDAAVSAALQMLGEVLDTDRVCLVETFDHPSDSSFPYW